MAGQPGVNKSLCRCIKSKSCFYVFALKKYVFILVLCVLSRLQVTHNNFSLELSSVHNLFLNCTNAHLNIYRVQVNGQLIKAL